MVAKKMVYVVIAVAVVSLAYVGWKLTSRNGYESADYSVVQADGDIELREYPDLMLATTDMNSRQQDNGSFGRLFKYISGGNDDRQKVAMTTPVLMELDSTENKGQMSFVIPKIVAERSIPQPTNMEVAINQRAGGLFAVIRFAGRTDPAMLKAQQNRLEAWIDSQEFEAQSKSEVASYDPPWTPGPFRRNEILIRIRNN